MRTISLIVVHCTANRAGSTLRMADIDRYHRSLGWRGCGYTDLSDSTDASP